ncbi:MAG TPA: hypothetical protein VMV92_00825 [Streptosporangiaceae bacterium]|nr:hypothetical protein [Streptosporangiaceae bacterium]
MARPGNPGWFAGSVAASSASNVWAASTNGAAVDHWDGRRWSRVTSGIPAAALLGPIASDGRGGLWLYAGSPADKPFLAHYRNGKWTRAAVPAAARGAVSVAAPALIPGTHTLWAVSGVGVGAFGTSEGAAILAYGH